jgi:hypothetical protein
MAKISVKDTKIVFYKLDVASKIEINSHEN